MIYLAVCFVVAVIASSYLIYDLSNKIVKERQDFDKERQILLNRIQDPEYKPPIERLTPAEKRQNMEELQRLQEEAEQYGLVGQIVE